MRYFLAPSTTKETPLLLVPRITLAAFGEISTRMICDPHEYRLSPGLSIYVKRSHSLSIVGKYQVDSHLTSSS